MNSWLWPDRVISKSESRKLREEHNKLVNLSRDMLDALEEIVAEFNNDYHNDTGGMRLAETIVNKFKR